MERSAAWASPLIPVASTMAATRHHLLLMNGTICRMRILLRGHSGTSVGTAAGMTAVGFVRSPRAFEISEHCAIEANAPWSTTGRQSDDPNTHGGIGQEAIGDGRGIIRSARRVTMMVAALVLLAS